MDQAVCGRGRVTPILMVVAVSFALAGAARAGDRAGDYDALMSEGVALRRAGDDRAALQRFQQAFEVNKTARALAQIGLAEQAIGHWGPADWHLRQALESADDPWIKKNRASITQALTIITGHVGQLEVSGSPAGAEVRVDGELIGQLPLARPITVTAGGVAVEVRAPDHVTIVRATTVAARALTREQFTLQALSPQPAARSEAPASAVSDGSPSGGSPPPAASPATPAGDADSAGTGAPPSRRWVLVLGSGGLAAASLAFGIVEHLAWQDKVESFGARPDCGTTFPSRGGAGCSQLYEDGQRLRTRAFVGYGLATAFAATAAVIYFTAPDRGPEPNKLACAPSLARPGLACAFRF